VADDGAVKGRGRTRRLDHSSSIDTVATRLRASVYQMKVFPALAQQTSTSVNKQKGERRREQGTKLDTPDEVGERDGEKMMALLAALLVLETKL
jgi:hypothetical protein